MINPNITDFISQKLNIPRRDMIEKDLLLSQLLYHLTSNKDFHDNYAFKGGTCLIRCYLGYYRFSEDLDFTFINQKELDNKSQKNIRKMLSLKINNLAKLLEEISYKLGLRFKPLKENKEYMQFGGSNAFVTFKLWYHSHEENKETFIKVQINFIEKLKFPIQEIPIKSIISDKIKHDFSIIYNKESEILLKSLKIKTYEIREILIEKIRAILTRRGIKSRDFIDIYMISKYQKIKFEEFEHDIIEKTKAMLRFEKYALNLENKKEIEFQFDKNKEQGILLMPINEKDFNDFLVKFNKFLVNLTEKIML